MLYQDYLLAASDSFLHVQGVRFWRLACSLIASSVLLPKICLSSKPYATGRSYRYARFFWKTSSYANLNVALKVVNQPVRSHLRSPSIREWMYPSYITPVSLLVCKEIIPSTHLTHLVLSSLHSKDQRKSWRAAGIAVPGEQDTNRSGSNPQLCTRSGLTQCMPL